MKRLPLCLVLGCGLALSICIHTAAAGADCPSWSQKLACRLAAVLRLEKRAPAEATCAAPSVACPRLPAPETAGPTPAEASTGAPSDDEASASPRENQFMLAAFAKPVRDCIANHDSRIVSRAKRTEGQKEAKTEEVKTADTQDGPRDSMAELHALALVFCGVLIAGTVLGCGIRFVKAIAGKK